MRCEHSSTYVIRLYKAKKERSDFATLLCRVCLNRFFIILFAEKKTAANERDWARETKGERERERSREKIQLNMKENELKQPHTPQWQLKRLFEILPTGDVQIKALLIPNEITRKINIHFWILTSAFFCCCFWNRWSGRLFAPFHLPPVQFS